MSAAPPGPAPWLSVLLTVLAKDVRTELRSKETLAMTSMFGAMTVFIYAFGFSTKASLSLAVLPGVLWATLLFAGTLGIGRTFAREARDGAFTALILSPAERSAVLAAKILANFAIMAAVMIVVVPLLAVMLRVDLTPHAGMITLLLVLGALGFAVVGTPMAVMAVSARFAEVLLPLVVFPLVSPIMIAGVTATGIVLGTTVAVDPWPWVKLMTAFDVAFAVGGLYLFDRMVSE